MTSHDDHLPFVVPGMIWDGVTEYQNINPPGEGDHLPPPHVRRRHPALQRIPWHRKPDGSVAREDSDWDGSKSAYPS